MQIQNIEIEQTTEFALPPAANIRELDHVTDRELDELPFGVIGLDPSGLIFRYNLAEARLARLDRNQVLGENFFRDIAPCTATPEFEQRFRAFVESGASTPISFPYVFDFKFGAQEVDVEVVRGSHANHYYLVINRRRFLPMRPDVPKETYAPLQSDLAPDEDRYGILRDEQTRRSVVASPIFFEALRYTWDRVAPRGWPVFTREWGHQWGRLAVVDLETAAQEDSGKSLRELSMQEAIDRIARYMIQHGWGRLQVDFEHAAAGAFVLELERNALAEAVGRSDVPRCELLGGLLRSVFSHLAGRVVSVREVSCKAQGRDRCRFIAVPQSKAGALDQAIDDHPGDHRQVLAALVSARPGPGR